MRPQLEKIDRDSKQKLSEDGMTVIEYDSEFFESILELEGVKELYALIDSEVGGLGTTLIEELESA